MASIVNSLPSHRLTMLAAVRSCDASHDFGAGGAFRQTIRTLTLAGALALCGCDNSSADATIEPPAEARTLIERDPPFDGRIHVTSAGRIVINADTPTCYRDDGFPINSATLFHALGQPRSDATGTSRQAPAVPGRCEFRDDTVLFWGTSSHDNQTNRYRITLVAWQGDAFWLGVVARRAANLHDRGRNFTHFEAPRDRVPFGVRMAASMDGDIDDLSQEFIAYMTRREQ